jgi:regulator of protease activity HflC (stomatin/prohibitin superfamily)
MEQFVTILVSFIGSFVVVPIILSIFRLFGVYAIVHEGSCQVYMLFGKVITILKEPGFHFLPFKLTWRAPIIHFIGKVLTVDTRIDQQYLRSQAVNSEEGAPMGVGIWYEMYVSDPVSFLFKNTDPRGSLAANVSNAAVRCLSNMKLGDMLENRHGMSRAVREEVSPKSNEWGYALGSVYVRKVHFRDTQMIRQIEEKVVNRLRQVTSAIKQDGANQVNIITSTAEKKAAVEFARASAIRPQIVGVALRKIADDPKVAETLFQVLELEKLTHSEARCTLMPKDSQFLSQMIVAGKGIPMP